MILCACGSFTDASAQIPQGAFFWLRADSGVTINTTLVANWADWTGSGKSAYQTNPVKQPQYIPSGINNLPLVHFDGVQNYMDCPSIFPISQDYSVTIVARFGDFVRANHLFSGNSRQLSTANTPYVTLRNDTAHAQLKSGTALSAKTPVIITVTYRESTKQGAIYINGEFSDSAVIGSNLDKNMYLGAYQGISGFLGDIAEVVLYRSVLSQKDRRQLESYLFKKYAITPPPAPDSIYTATPRHLQLYQRDYDDSATVTISGNYPVDGYDSIYLLFSKNNVLLSRKALPLHYNDGSAPFSFAPRIHAELSEYSFTLGVTSAVEDRRIAYRDSIVCGDVFLIDGQANAINNNLKYTNEFYRTFGKVFSQDAADTAWAISSTAVDLGGGTEVGSWGLRLQENMKNSYHIPTCIINGAVGGATIDQYLRDELNPTNLATVYGAMLYRAQKSHLIAAPKVLFFYEGEADGISNYASDFHTLYKDWKQDYPSVQKIYLMQVRPSECSPVFTADLRDVQRRLPETYPDIEAVSTMGIPGYDGCLFDSAGYTQIGDQLFRLLTRDFYGSKDISQISSPNIWQAYYTTSKLDEIGLSFLPGETQFVLPADTTIGGIAESLKDYFYLNDTAGVVQSITTVKSRIFLKLKQPSDARLISYLPDKFYSMTSIIYEGPWLENSRGIGAFSFYHVPIVDSSKAAVGNSVVVNDHSLYAFPNPASGKFTIHYTLPRQENIRIAIVDILGRTVASVVKTEIPKGENLETFDGLQLAGGVYVCSVITPEKTESATIVISR
jgi:hypothetical protein